MKYVFKILIALTVLASTAQAQTSTDETMRYGWPFTLAKYVYDNLIGKNSSGNIVIPVASGKKHQITVGGTPVAEIDSGGQIANPIAAPVMTPMTALTPVAAAVLSARVSQMATAAPTFAIQVLPAATSNAGKSFGLYNKSASPVLLVANGVLTATDVINGLGASGTPYSCATTKFCDCRVIGAGNYMCVSQ